jgi:hypothetical protein
MTIRRRRPGGGRKPIGQFSKSATFNTRIDPETRRALDAAAQKNGVSISAIAGQILRKGLQKPTGKPHNQSIARAITLLAERIEEGTKLDWRKDPFTGQALRYAVEALLFHFAATPEGAPAIPPSIAEGAGKMPREFAERFSKPAGYANALAYNLILELEQTSPSMPINEWSVPIFFSGESSQLALIRRGLQDEEGKIS